MVLQPALASAFPSLLPTTPVSADAVVLPAPDGVPAAGDGCPALDTLSAGGHVSPGVAAPRFLGFDLLGGERAVPHARPLLPACAGPQGRALGGALPVAAPEVAAPASDQGGTALAVYPADPSSVEVVTRVTPRRSPGQARWVGPSEPERPVMEILFLCLDGGRRLYGVRLNGQEIFVGTRPECDRFLAIHNEKVAQEQAEARRVPRARPFAVRSYRSVRA